MCHDLPPARISEEDKWQFLNAAKSSLEEHDLIITAKRVRANDPARKELTLEPKKYGERKKGFQENLPL
jgi:hypothetical protein